MGGVTVFCIISGCTPEVPSNLLYMHSFGPVVTSAFKALADEHELASQDDMCVIAPVHPSGQPYAEGWEDGVLSRTQPDHRVCDLNPEVDIRIVPHCVMGDEWDIGFVDGPPAPNKQNWSYLVSSGCTLMVQTFALDILALVTNGRMTLLRLWRLAMHQGFDKLIHPWCLDDVDYGEVTDLWLQGPDEFPIYTEKQLMELEKIGDVGIVKERMVNEGLFWLWMAPDRFPVSPTKEYVTSVLPKVHPSGSRSAIESLLSDVLILIVSSLPLVSVLNLASASRSLLMTILGNDYLACAWLYNNAPWWIPVPTQTPSKSNQTEQLPGRAYPASEWGGPVQLSVEFPVGLDWAYIKRCVQSGSMRNRRRIWRAAVDIERIADLAGL